MTANPGPEGVEMRGGSQAKMRFLGGAMTKDSILPRRGALKRSPHPGQVDVERITLHLEDRMGFGPMDPGMRKKYERILGGVAFSIESVIRENVGDLVDGSDPDTSFATPSKRTAQAGADRAGRDQQPVRFIGGSRSSPA
jgi:hypothetical protein